MPETLHTEHSVSILAPAATVYDILADVSRWPLCFPPTIHAERASGTGEQEQVRIWALANGQPRTWTSRRVLDKSARRISFRSETPQPPVKSMVGTWIVTEVAPDETEVRLLHDFSLLTDVPAQREWVDRAVETNSTAELGSLKTAAESPDGLILDFTDTVTIEGTPAAAYDFIYRCAEWPSRLPHVARLAVTDHGIGITAADQDLLFTRFGRLDTEQTAGIPGTGLGLYLARDLAHRHGGDITLRSAPGLGSTFTLGLPLAPAPET